MGLKLMDFRLYTGKKYEQIAKRLKQRITGPHRAATSPPGSRPVAQVIADVVCFRYLSFGGLRLRRHSVVDELGWGGCDERDAQPDEVIAWCGLFGSPPGDADNPGDQQDRERGASAKL